MTKGTIAEDRFNAGYVEGYKRWLSDNLQDLSFSDSSISRGITDKEAETKIELEQVKNDARKMHKAFLKKQEEDEYTIESQKCAIESMTQELESLKSNLKDLDTWMEARKESTRYQTWDDKGCKYDGYWLMAQYTLWIDPKGAE